ncbi:TIR domain-containing protein [Gillisia sp. JM1]|uniref:TIR domain-containing protein n=1 Tax=Gillisia sp. JM1 TaxID=1283286 RepID=UPI0003F8C922|nr:TIR domain-containing protein [Gillisia sp. JM1]
MGHKNKTYIIFDGDNDKWAFARMKGWKSLKNIDFDFENAHDEYPLTSTASNEDYIKSKLRKRFQNASQVIVLIGDSTKNLYKYVRWELEIAQNLNIPIIAVNLNGDRKQNNNTCPPIIRDTYVVHIPFKMRIIKYALDNFPSEFKKRTTNSSIGGRTYNDPVYASLGLND